MTIATCQISPGVLVEWPISAGTLDSVARGVFMGLVPAGMAPADAVPALDSVPPSQKNFSALVDNTNDRAIVRQERRCSKSGRRLKTYYYAPLMQSVKVLKPELQPR